ncbi:MAG: nuclease-related domain-containing protein, partial [Thiohalocapsa sp.]
MTVEVTESVLGTLFGNARPHRRGAAGEAAVSRALRRVFRQVADDLILPDGRGGLTQVDHLALTPAGLLVVETKNYRGLILGQAHEANWTQVNGRHRNKFQNPLRQNYAHTEAVTFHAPGVPVLGRVVFLDDAQFPRGVPRGVVTLGTLGAELDGLRGGDVPPPTEHGWQRILNVALSGAAARQAHIDGLKERHGRRHAAQGTGDWSAGWNAFFGPISAALSAVARLIGFELLRIGVRLVVAVGVALLIGWIALSAFDDLRSARHASVAVRSAQPGATGIAAALAPLTTARSPARPASQRSAGTGAIQA